MRRKQAYRQLRDSFAQLSNPLRFKIFLKILKEGCECDLDTQRGFEGNCVSAIVNDLGIPQSTASTYIKDLKEANLIECKKNGRYVYCKPQKETLTIIKSFIDSSLEQIR